jgi:deoxyribose-phosphate aldolase
MDYIYSDISKMMDHALLKPTLRDDELDHGCRIAVEYNCASVCVMPYDLARCARKLEGTSVLAGTTVGFPHGANATSVKAAETRQALDDGCREIDMVVNIGKVLSGDWSYVREDLKSVADLVHARGRKLKVIFENCYLHNDHKIRLCEISAEVGADWVKTSTGFGPSGATVEDVKLMRAHSPAKVQIKASGGIRDLDEVLEFRALGVTRIGTSRTKFILEECRRVLGKW